MPWLDCPNPGQRLFEHENHPFKLRLVESTATTTGVTLANYHPER
jgi:hypothetical protein